MWWRINGENDEISCLASACEASTQQKSPMVVTVNHSQPAKGEEEEEEGAN